MVFNQDMNSTAHDTARLLLKLRDTGMTFAQVTAAVDGGLSSSDLEACADSFRSPDLRQEFRQFVGLE